MIWGLGLVFGIKVNIWVNGCFGCSYNECMAGKHSGWRSGMGLDHRIRVELASYRSVYQCTIRHAINVGMLLIFLFPA